MSGAPRLSKLDPAALSAAQRNLYDTILGGVRGTGPQHFSLTDAVGGLEGPFNAMLLSPPVGLALQALGGALRYGSTFTLRAREIAILVVGYAWHSDFEIYAHEAVGRAVGLTDAELAGLRTGQPEALADPVERLIAETAAALAARNDLTGNEYARALSGLGAAQLFELTTLAGYYATLALQLRVFRVATPD